MNIGLLVGALMLLMMLIPLCCCRLSDERYKKIIERYEQRSKNDQKLRELINVVKEI